jgi:hypothetical protein
MVAGALLDAGANINPVTPNGMMVQIEPTTHVESVWI